jgi:hypothetical protein
MHGVRRVALAGVAGLMLMLAVSACSSSSRMSAPAGSEISEAPSEVSVAPTAADPSITDSITDSVTGEGGAASVVLVGDRGPGGGIVFYDAGSQRSWGRYLEAAPARWSGSWADPNVVWCQGLRGDFSNLPTGTEIGTGRANTGIIIQACGPDSAAGVAAAYRGGGKDDWFLPSKDELNALFLESAVVGARPTDYVWSSSQTNDDAGDFAWFQYFGFGGQDRGNKGLGHRVRPVRAF